VPGATHMDMATKLAERVNGPVYAPDDAGYAQEIAAFNTTVVHKPEMVVGVVSANDVVESVRFARAHGYHVTVQGAAHGAHVRITSGLLISTRRLAHVSIDAGTATATIGAGARWAAVVAAAAEHGLAPVAGSSTNVGVVGYLLGGGLGPLARSHGFSSDYLLGATVVTGDGALVEASLRQNPDLFWALRGGRDGLGIVTEVRVRLIPLRRLYGGSLFFAEEHIEATLRAWVDWTAGADAQVTTSVAIVRFPPLEVVPAPLRGRRLLSLRFAYPGVLAEGARLAAPLRAAAPVYLDALGELPAAQIARIHNDPTAPVASWVTGVLLTHVDHGFATTLLAHFGAGTDPPFIATEVRHLGEATGRDVDGGSAVGGRGANFACSVVGVPKPELFDHVIPAAAGRLWDGLRPWTAAETNINLLGNPHAPAPYASAWPADTFARLADVRRRYDPDGVFAGSERR
jgi:FAD/FMN-containing dehydrogenase